MQYDSRVISSEQSEQYAKLESRSADQYINRYREWIDLHLGGKPATIVDIGGGPGHFASKVNEYCGGGA